MNKGWKYGIGLGMVIVLLFMANLLIGSVPIPVSDVFSILMGHEGEKASWSFIVWESRLPQVLTALLCGGALAVCGLMLQTAFKNPLAGPSILGINSGASLGVAFVMLFFGGSISAGTFSLSGFFSVLAGAFVAYRHLLPYNNVLHRDMTSAEWQYAECSRPKSTLRRDSLPESAPAN